MVKKRTIIIFFLFLALAIFFSILSGGSPNVFFTWFYIGLWILFTIKFFAKRRTYNEFNSPHNTSFFVFLPFLVGFFYNFWSFYTGFLGQNIISFLPLFYISLWTLIFAFPYVLYGLNILRLCYKKFHVVFIYKDKSVKARKFAIIYSIFLIIFVLIYLFSQLLIVRFLAPFLTPTYSPYPFNYIDLTILFFSIYCVYLFIRRGLFGSSRSIPEVTSDFIARQRRRVDRLRTTPVRSSTTRRSSSRSSTPRSRARSTPRRTSQRTSVKRKTKSRASTKPKTTARTAKTSRKSLDFNKYKPKAGILSLEDFKCIFCFDLPEYPKDKGRGVVLCPKCRHPAHADEFKEWMKDSPLCSRCDSPIPSSFRRNPRIIPISQYVKIINEFKKKHK
ncbi:MAG: hypothetical protein GF383_06305 [Candidatus Lokiarchaeota archaeon]|nr:hypothetical protein [Candidatus Lokiarchaeota archaeon]MBD3339616.1 hypothetical protein [Candidatus Lokiarchaeota archaeon]